MTSGTEANNPFDGHKLRTVSVGDAIYEALLDAITTGKLEPGSEIRESRLAEQLGASRTPLREALPRLINLGLIERLPSGSLRVPLMSTEEVEGLVEVRELLEGLTARRVAEAVRSGRLDRSALARIERPVRAMEASADLPSGDLVLLGERFHLALADLSGNRIAARLLQQVLGALGRYRFTLWKDLPRRDVNVDVHKRIFDHIAAGDVERAEAEMRAHIRESKDVYATLIGAMEHRPVASRNR